MMHKEERTLSTSVLPIFLPILQNFRYTTDFGSVSLVEYDDESTSAMHIVSALLSILSTTAFKLHLRQKPIY